MSISPIVLAIAVIPAVRAPVIVVPRIAPAPIVRPAPAPMPVRPVIVPAPILPIVPAPRGRDCSPGEPRSDCR